MMDESNRIKRLPPYVLNAVNALKSEARARGEDVIDFGMGNPDQKTPSHIVDKLVEVAKRENTNRYSLSIGIPRLRRAICEWYRKRYDVVLDPEKEAVVTIGSKEGLAHIALGLTGPGDSVLVPDPCYPIHVYGFIIAGASIHRVPLLDENAFMEHLEKSIGDTLPKPKGMVLNFPANPTTHCVDLDFFKHVVALAKANDMWIIHDFAYADLVFEGEPVPSILQVPGAIDVAVESYSLSKTYNMPGWRVGFMCGNPKLIDALRRIKSYMDYGLYLPIQVASIKALESAQTCVEDVKATYRERRDVLCEGLAELGWEVNVPRATMFVWAKIPKAYIEMGSMAFSTLLLEKANVAVSPGIGFGEVGDTHVRFSLIENTQRIRQALRNMKNMFNGTQTKGDPAWSQ